MYFAEWQFISETLSFRQRFDWVFCKIIYIILNVHWASKSPLCAVTLCVLHNQVLHLSPLIHWQWAQTPWQFSSCFVQGGFDHVAERCLRNEPRSSVLERYYSKTFFLFCGGNSLWTHCHKGSWDNSNVTAGSCAPNIKMLKSMWVKGNS